MDNLDNFIKNKLEELPVEFNEAHWQAAEKMIIEDEKGKRYRFLKRLFIAQLFLIAALPTLFLISEYSTISEVNDESNKNLKGSSNTEIANTVFIENKEKSIDDVRQKNEENAFAEVESINERIESINTNEGDNPGIVTAGAAAKEVQKHATKVATETETPSSEKNTKSNVLSLSIESINTNESENTEIATTGVVTKNIQKYSSKIALETNTPSTENNTEPTALDQPIESIVTTPISITDEEQTLTVPSSSISVNELDEDLNSQKEPIVAGMSVLQEPKTTRENELDALAVNSDNTDVAESQNISFEDEQSTSTEIGVDEISKTEEPRILSRLLSQKIDFLPLVSIKPLSNPKEGQINDSPVLYSDKNPFRSVISLYVATTMYPYTQVGTEKLLGYTAGLNYTKNIRKSWSVDVGVHYRIRDGHFTGSQNSQQDSFSFGKISTEHSLQAHELHSLEIPIAIAFNKKRHQALLGVNYARLLGVRGVLNKVDDIENNGTIEQIDRGWFEDNSFKENRFDVFAAYYFTIKPGLSFGAKAHYVIGGHLNKDIPSDVYLESKSLFIDFGVRYDLIKR